MRYAVLPILLLFSGCATIMNGRYQEIGVGTSPAGAECKIGSNMTVKAPSVVRLKRSEGHTVLCELPGHESASAAVGSSASGWLWGDLIFGGLIGLAVDFGTGGAWKLKPDNVQLTLAQKPEVKAESVDKPREDSSIQKTTTDVPASSTSDTLSKPKSDASSDGLQP